MSPFFILLISSLAVWRCAEAIAIDNGPFHVFKFLRKTCSGHPILCEFMTCQYCQSAWWAMACVCMLWYNHFIAAADIVMWWAGIWGGAMAINRVVRERT